MRRTITELLAVLLPPAAGVLLVACTSATPEAAVVTERVTVHANEVQAAALDERDQALYDWEQTLDEREAELDQREAELDQREAELDARPSEDVFSLDDLTPEQRAAVEGLAAPDPVDEYKRELCKQQTSTPDEFRNCMEYGVVPAP